ncbi:hypothetical protein ACFWFU_38660 [Streptomyces sp. NPDC060235]|uniref:hypothetical protein n=1 Tax=Streptomyces sp. NPDC060235 TaxID=3347080 RepID=UPI0036608E9A
MNEIEEAVSWSGPAVIILFTLGSSDSTLQDDEFELSGMKPDNVYAFQLGPDPEGQRGTVQSYDLTFNDADHDFLSYLRACLQKASTEAEGIAWLGFEGSFHYDNLFTDEVADQIYGYCVPDGAPAAIWDDETLKSDRWKREIAEVRSVLERDFPMPHRD